MTSSSRYSDGRYVAHNARWHDEDASWKATQVLEILNENGLSPKTICDIGCGSGGVLAALATAMPDATLIGIEMSPDAVAIAHGEHPEVDVRQGDAGVLRDACDVVLMLDVFEHVEDYIGFLRTLRSRGRHFVFHIPLDMTAFAVLRGRPIMAAREGVGHLHYFSKDTALATLIDAGYHVIDWRYAAAIDMPARTLKTKMSKWPRKVGFRLEPDLTARALGGYTLLVIATP